MRASRLPFPESSYWASNVVSGVGLGTQSLIDGVARGLGGAVYEPYSGWTKQGFVGGLAGFGRGLGYLVYRPIKGGFDFIAQPIAGALNTPNFIYNKFAIQNDPTSVPVTNFKIFGMHQSQMREREGPPPRYSEQAMNSILIYDSTS